MAVCVPECLRYDWRWLQMSCYGRGDRYPTLPAGPAPDRFSHQSSAVHLDLEIHSQFRVWCVCTLINSHCQHFWVKHPPSQLPWLPHTFELRLSSCIMAITEELNYIQLMANGSGGGGPNANWMIFACLKFQNRFTFFLQHDSLSEELSLFGQDKFFSEVARRLLSYRFVVRLNQIMVRCSILQNNNYP